MGRRRCTCDVTSLFQPRKGDVLLGFLALTYGLEADYAENRILRPWGIDKRDKACGLEFLCIAAHHSQIRRIRGLLCDRVISVDPGRGMSFHPKLYLLKYRRRGVTRFRFVTGSVNLTRQGFELQHECVAWVDDEEASKANQSLAELLGWLRRKRRTLGPRLPGAGALKFRLPEKWRFIAQLPDEGASLGNQIGLSIGSEIADIHAVSPFIGIKAASFTRGLAERTSFYSNSDQDLARSLRGNPKDQEGNPPPKPALFCNIQWNDIKESEGDLEAVYEEEVSASKDWRKELRDRLESKGIIRNGCWAIEDERELRERIRNKDKKKDLREALSWFRQDIQPVYEKTNRRRFNHGKLIFLRRGSGCQRLYLGSGNLTENGLGLPEGSRRNVECGVVITGGKNWAISDWIRVCESATKSKRRWGGDLPAYTQRLPEDLSDQEKMAYGENPNPESYWLDDLMAAIRIISVQVKGDRLTVNLRVDKAGFERAAKAAQVDGAWIEGIPAWSKGKRKRLPKHVAIPAVFALRGVRIQLDRDGRRYLRQIPLPLDKGKAEALHRAASLARLSAERLFDPSFAGGAPEDDPEEDEGEREKKRDPAAGRRRFPFQALMRTLFPPKEDDQRRQEAASTLSAALDWLALPQNAKEFKKYYGMNPEHIRALINFIRAHLPRDKEKRRDEWKKRLRQWEKCIGGRQD